MTHSVPSRPPRGTLEQIFEDSHPNPRYDLATLYRQKLSVRDSPFLFYLHADFPQVRRLSQLRRDPHLLGWFRWLCEHHPPLCNKTREKYLLCLRRVFDDLTVQGPSMQRRPHPPRGFPSAAAASSQSTLPRR